MTTFAQLGLAPEILRHRIMPSYEALADEKKMEDFIDMILKAIPLPKVHMGDPYKTQNSQTSGMEVNL